MRLRSLLILGLSAFALTTVPSIASPPGAHAARAPGDTRGRDEWGRIEGVAADGSEIEDGFTCRVHTVVDLRNGDWRRSVRCPMFASAAGIGAKGAWREDRSGWVHPLDSPEARKLAVTDRWLNRIGPYLPGRLPAGSKRLPPAQLHHVLYQRAKVTPAHGRSVTVWSGGQQHLIARVVMWRSFQLRTTDYGDYRPVNGVMLPFRIVSWVGAARARAHVETVARYELLRTIARRSLQPPADPAADTKIPLGGAHLPLAFSDDGKLLVEAKLDGKGPFPFVLDTGGHAILTPATAGVLGIEVSGRSVSYGAGAGSTPLGFARVHSIRLGDAQIDDQSVLVMPLSPVLTDRGAKAPVAGILGLEVFERFAVTIDPAKRTMILQPFDSFRPPAAAAVLRLRFTKDMPLIRAALDGERGIFGLDTGNSGPLMLFPDWAARNGLASYYGAGVPQPEGGEGGMFLGHMAFIRSLRIGGLAVRGRLIGFLTPRGVGAVSNPSEAGNLGMTVWRAFRFAFDYRTGRLYLSPRPHYMPPKPPAATAGMIAVKLTPQAFSVIQVMPGGPAAKAGLKKGDRIVALDGVAAKDLASLYLMKRVEKGEPGTVLRLTLAHGRTLNLALGPNTAMLRALEPRLH
jgi:hypothetical protein